MLFNDRHDAGRQLASYLNQYKNAQDVLVLGLARGGVVVAFEIARALKLPLNVVVVRKIGAPHNEELALGAVTERGEGIFNEHLISLLGVSSDYLKREIETQKNLAQKRLALYRGSAKEFQIKGKTVLLVDDGIATGASILAAIKDLRMQEPARIILAVPVAAPDSLQKISKEVDETVCLSSPSFFESVGGFYRLFDQTTDEEIISLLETRPFA